MDKLCEMINIGPVLIKKLTEAGIDSPAKLTETGSENAFLKLKGIEPTSCLNTLLALEGAIMGIRWHHLPKSRKEELKQFLKLKYFKK